MDQKDLVKRIVSEVKSQGAFDEFRKDSIADMDTKPAYQNLKQRVETTVQQFLAKQEWTPDMNKNHLRERLRRHIMESGFLDKGVERIVDQVVNPRIPTVIKPKIQEIAYKMMGMPLPQRSHQPPPPPPMMHQLPPLPLSAPTLTLDTHMMNLLPTDLEQVSPDSDKATELSESKEEAMDMDVDDDESPPFEPLEKCASPLPPKYSPMRPSLTSQNINDVANVCTETQDTALSAITNEEVSRSMDAVASDSQVSTVSRDFAETTPDAKNEMSEHAAVNISEEAQMPKFSDNPIGVNAQQETSELHFDIKKDEIKFEGTERKNNPLDDEAAESKNLVLSPSKKFNKPEENSSFQFANISGDTERFPVPESSLGSLDDTTSSTQMKAGYKSKIEKKDTFDKTTSNSSQSSRHKKHSKHKHRSQDRDQHRSTDRERSKDGDKPREKNRDNDRERDRERERTKEKDRSGKSKHTSSSSKQSTSSNKHSSIVQKKDDGSTASGKLAYSSSNSSSRSETQDKKRERSEREQSKRHTSTSSRDYSENSSSKKEKLKTDAVRDDHNEKKEKHFRRKSRDSKDKDKSPSQSSGRSIQKSSSGSSKSKSRHESSSRSSKSVPGNDAPKSNVKSQRLETHLNNVVLLNDILQNPSTDCIELAAKTSGNCIEIVKHAPIRPSEKHCERISSDNDEVLSGFYEEEDCNPLRDRLHVIDSVLETGSSRVALLGGDRASSPVMEPIIRKSTDSVNDDETKNKKGVLRRRQKNSHTPSEISLNSKENVGLPKNSDSVSNSPAHKQDSALSKLTQQQRYSSEDLYKPRPVLSQKSKRRGLNSAF